MIITREIGDKGQVVIPRDIRLLLGLKNRQRVVFEVKANNEVILKPEQDSEKFLDDFLNVPKLKRRLDAKEIKKIILGQYDERFEKLHRR